MIKRCLLCSLAILMTFCASGHHKPFNKEIIPARDLSATKHGIIDAPLWGLWYMRLTGQLSIANYYRLYNSPRVFTIETPPALPVEDRVNMQRTAVQILIKEYQF